MCLGGSLGSNLLIHFYIHIPSKRMFSIPSIKTAFIGFSFTISTLSVVSAATIVAENFGGTGVDLNGTTADTFDSAITTAGGSATWVANASFNDDGSLVNGNNQSAYLNLGSYINDARGTASGKFTLSVTLTEISGGSWAGIAFFESNTPNVNDQFTEAGALGAASFIYRDTGDLDGFAIGSSNNIDNNNNAETGSQLLTMVLDLTPGGGYDGSANYGTVAFFQGDEATGTSLGSFTYTADQSFGSVGLTTAGGGTDGTYSGFELTQVPEPAVAMLASLGLLLLMGRRR